jgi:hypothetical protein
MTEEHKRNNILINHNKDNSYEDCKECILDCRVSITICGGMCNTLGWKAGV